MPTPEEMLAYRLRMLSGSCPWPESRPDLPEDFQGWFGGPHVRMLARCIGPWTGLIVELGSWLGRSTKYLLDAAPDAAVIAIDHWAGSPEHFADPMLADTVPRSYDQFLANLWPYRERLHPLRAATLPGMSLVASLRLEPDLVYVDAGHDIVSVSRDLELAYELFPGARIAGDDWNWPTVRHAVERFAHNKVFRVHVEEEIAWALTR